MRALREHPRVTVAKAVGAICLVLIGVAIGAVDGRGDGERMKATEARLVSAQKSVSAREAKLRLARTRGQRAAAALDRAQRRISALTRTNHRLRRELRSATRTRKARKRRE
jgi:hypothetical protein